MVAALIRSAVAQSNCHSLLRHGLYSAAFALWADTHCKWAKLAAQPGVFIQIVIEVLVCRCIVKGKTKVKYEKECSLKGNPHKSSWWPANSPKRRVALTTCCRHDRGNRSADDEISREAQQREGAEQRDCQGRQSAQFADRRRPQQFKFTLRLTVSLCDLAWDGARVDCFQCTALLECFSVSLWQTRTGSRRRQKLVL